LDRKFLSQLEAGEKNLMEVQFEDPAPARNIIVAGGGRINIPGSPALS